MKILFLTGLYSKESEIYYSSALKQGALANPSNVYQWGVVKGMIENNMDFEVCSFPFLPTFPSGIKIKQTTQEDLILAGNTIGKSYSYSTIAGIKEFDIIRKLKTILHKWARTCVETDCGIILIYSLYGPFLKAAVDCAKVFHNIKVCPIVTDLFISSLSNLKNSPFLKKVQGLFEYRRIKYGLENADTFVLLAKGMVKYVPRAIDNYVIIEGIAGDDSPCPSSKVAGSEKKLLYTGSLGVHTSVKELVDAFLMTTDESFRLIICGAGYYSDYIELKAKEDNRIVFKGAVSREQAVRLQKEATLLINPRLSSITDTPYSFPSKTMEYLVSGTPMIGYKLEGIPSEYYKYFYMPHNESVEALAEVITETLRLPQKELDQRAFESWRFITEKKTAKQQISKLDNYFRTTFR